MKTFEILYNLRTSLNKIFFKMRPHFKENCVYFAASIKLSPAAFIKSLFLLNIICLILLNLYLTYIVSPFLFNLILFFIHYILKLILTLLAIVGYLFYITLNIFITTKNIIHSLTSNNFYFFVAPLWYSYFPYFPMYRAVILISPLLLLPYFLILGFTGFHVYCILIALFSFYALLFIISHLFNRNLPLSNPRLKSNFSYLSFIFYFSRVLLMLLALVLLFMVMLSLISLFVYSYYLFYSYNVYNYTLMRDGCTPYDRSIFGPLSKVSFEEYLAVFQVDIIYHHSIGMFANTLIARNVSPTKIFDEPSWFENVHYENYSTSLKDNDMFIPESILSPLDPRDINIVTYWVYREKYEVFIQRLQKSYGFPVTPLEDISPNLHDLSPEFEAIVRKELRSAALTFVEDLLNLYRPEYTHKLNNWIGHNYRPSPDSASSLTYSPSDTILLAKLRDSGMDYFTQWYFWTQRRLTYTALVIDPLTKQYVPRVSCYDWAPGWLENSPSKELIHEFYGPATVWKKHIDSVRENHASYHLKDKTLYYYGLRKLRVDNALEYRKKELLIDTLVKQNQPSTFNFSVENLPMET